MKTIEQIIENENYKRLTSDLDSRVAEIAEKIRIILTQLEEDSIDNYGIVTREANCGASRSYLAVNDDEYGCPVSSLEDSTSYHYCGDFHCWIGAATNKQKLTFLNKAKKLFQILDERKEKVCTDIESALKAAEGL